MTTTMDTSSTMNTLQLADVAEAGELLRAHTGRDADLDTLAHWIATSPSAGARLDGELIGFAVSQRFAPDLIEMTNLLVAPTARNQGIGQALVRAVEADAQTRGLAGIVLVNSMATPTVTPKRSAASLYLSLGYHVLMETEATVVFGRTLSSGP